MTVVGMLTVPVKDGVALFDGDGGGFNVTLGAAAPAMDNTGEAIAPPAINRRLSARRAATLTSRGAFNALITLPPSMFQARANHRVHELGYASDNLPVSYDAIHARQLARRRFVPQFAEMNRATWRSEAGGTLTPAGRPAD